MITLSRHIPKSLLWVVFIATSLGFMAPQLGPRTAFAKVPDREETTFSHKFIAANLPVPKKVVLPAPAPVEKTAVAVKKIAPKATKITTVNSQGRREVMLVATSYSSTPDQTDSNPFITASGTHVHWGTVACNFLPFGTKVMFPDYFGNQIFTVEDRMAKRFSDRADIWFPSREAAHGFGRHTVRMVIL